MRQTSNHDLTMCDAVMVTTKRLGVSLMEVTVASGLMGVLIVTSLQVVAGMLKSQRFNEDRARAELVVQDLLTEIAQQSYLDPTQAPVFGPESGEATNPASRINFDDVDDYQNWTESPPQSRSGLAWTGWNEWTRSVSVVHVDPNDWNSSLGNNSDQGFKRITVVVSRQGIELARGQFVRSSSWKQPPYE